MIALRSSGPRRTLPIQNCLHSQGKAVCSLELAHAVDLAAYTGLRLGDLIRLVVDTLGDDAIVLPTGKSRDRREAIIPLYDELRDVRSNPEAAATVLTSLGAALDASGLSTSGAAGKERHAGLGGQRPSLPRPTRHCGDQVLRGWAHVRVIAEIMGWEEATSRRSSAAMSVAGPPREPQSHSSTRPEGEHKLQNQLQNHHPEKWTKCLERVKGIEPSSSAWKAVALPLSYTRAGATAIRCLLIRSLALLMTYLCCSFGMVGEVGLEPTKA